MSKGSYGKGRLSVSRAYLYPRSRRLMNWIGLGAGLVFIVIFLFSLLVRSGEFASGGGLSSPHANLENDCNACHRTLAQKAGDATLATGGAEDGNCMNCHGGLDAVIGPYSYQRHYVYTSGDSTGLAQAVADHKELPCASCHPEHLGQEATIIDVSDTQCLSCHGYGSFNGSHPQFDFHAESKPDDSTLIFTHVRHTKEVQKTFGLAAPCEYCHRLAENQRTFQAISFEDHCQECHLNGAQGSGRFPLRDPGDPQSVGAETLEMIQNRGTPGTLWAHLANPNEYKELAGVKKKVVTHRDPWILENLRQVRRRLYPSLGIAGLLDTYGLASNENPKVLYREAAATLNRQTDALNTRGELPVKQDLNRIRGFLNMTASMMNREDVFPSPAPFITPYDRVNEALTPEQQAELFAFADTLTHLCQVCHTVTNATIARVQKGQSALTRSRFDHGPHLLIGECLDCHASIPLDPEEVAEFNPQTFDWATDRSDIQNLPEISNCQTCHGPRKAANACITCHTFHPTRFKMNQIAGGS